MFSCATLLATATALCSTPCNGQARRSYVVEKRVERVLRDQAYKGGAAGIAFGMVQNRSTIVECYIGYGSVNDKIRVDSSSVFTWASLSKGVTAVCALKMADKGQFNLDADISIYLPELDLRTPVTARQLLAMQGGFGGYEEYPELLELGKLDRNALTQRVIIERMAGKRLVFAPGNRYGYSSPGYILLSIAMERAAKRRFAEIVDEIIAKPLKLSSFRVGGIAEADVLPYRLVNGKREQVERNNDDWRLGAGAIKSNLPDALVFASSLIQSSILTPDSSKELFKRRAFVKRAGSKSELVGITYGFMRVGDGPDASIAASGLHSGARSLLIIYPRQQMASIMFANTAPLDIETIQIAAMKALVEK